MPHMSFHTRKQILKRFYIACGLGAVAVYALLMVLAFPCWISSSHPVLVSIGAPVDAEFHLGFAEGEALLPLVPLDQSEPYAWKWATELPPRTHYDLYLEFPYGTNGEWLLSGIRLTTVSPETRHLDVDIDRLTYPEDGFVRVRKIDDKVAIQAQPGSRILLPEVFPQQPLSTWFRNWLVATWGYVLIAGIALLLLVTALRFPDGVHGAKLRPSIAEVSFLALGLFAGISVHLHLVGQTLPGLDVHESFTHLSRALDLPQLLEDPEKGLVFTSVRPGYPSFLARILPVTGWELGGVTLVQALLYCFSIAVLAGSLWGLVRGYWIGLVSFIALLSPMAVWASRQIAPDSLFSSLWILSLAAFIFLWRQRDGWRLAGWIAFSCLLSLCVLTRITGLALLVLPGFLLVGTLWWSYSLRGRYLWKVPLLWKTLFHVGIPVLTVALLLALAGNASHEELASRGDEALIEKARTRAALFTGMVDLRAFHPESRTEAFLQERFGSGWKVADTVYPEGFRDSLTEVLPWRTVFAGWGRAAGWALFYPDSRAHDGRPLHEDLSAKLGFSGPEEKQAILGMVADLGRESGKPLSLGLVDPDPWTGLYNRSWVGLYPWIYRVLFFGALVGWVFALVERKYLCAAFIAPVLFQMLLFVYWMYVPGRYIHILEGSLCFAFLAGWACVSPRTRQQATDENDRRSTPPIRPKRLLTRFDNENGAGF